MIKEEFLYQALRSDDKDVFIKEYLKSIYEKEIKVKHKINIFDFCGSKTTALTGVFYKNGYANASNGHIALRIKADYKKEWEEEVVDKKGNVLECIFPKFPNMDKLITDEVGTPVSLSIKQVEQCYADDKIEALIKDSYESFESEFYKNIWKLITVSLNYRMHIQQFPYKLYASNAKGEFCTMLFNKDINKFLI